MFTMTTIDCISGCKRQLKFYKTFEVFNQMTCIKRTPSFDQQEKRKGRLASNFSTITQKGEREQENARMNFHLSNGRQIVLQSVFWIRTRELVAYWRKMEDLEGLLSWGHRESQSEMMENQHNLVGKIMCISHERVISISDDQVYTTK